MTPGFKFIIIKSNLLIIAFFVSPNRSSADPSSPRRNQSVGSCHHKSDNSYQHSSCSSSRTPGVSDSHSQHSTAHDGASLAASPHTPTASNRCSDANSSHDEAVNAKDETSDTDNVPVTYNNRVLPPEFLDEDNWYLLDETSQSCNNNSSNESSVDMEYCEVDRNSSSPTSTTHGNTVNNNHLGSTSKSSNDPRNIVTLEEFMQTFSKCQLEILL